MCSEDEGTKRQIMPFGRDKTGSSCSDLRARPCHVGTSLTKSGYLETHSPIQTAAALQNESIPDLNPSAQTQNPSWVDGWQRVDGRDFCLLIDLGRNEQNHLKTGSKRLKKGN